LTNEYVLVSPNRTERPWLGQVEPPQTTHLPEYDESCYLCPGASRSSGQRNPFYTGTFTFENDFAAVLPAPTAEIPRPIPLHPLMTVEPVHGVCDVLVFHPRHDLAMARLDPGDIEKIIEEWIRIYLKRGTEKGIHYVQIFENKGAMMGCSNPHPHGQVWSVSVVPTIPAQELRSLKKYALTNSQPSTAPKGYGGRQCLLCEYVHMEMGLPKDDGRLVLSNEYWVALVPWWATWPFEILLLPYHRHVESIDQLNSEEKKGFSEILSRITKCYDNLFRCSFPYSMGIHQRPVPAMASTQSDVSQSADDESNYAHLHLHFEPPLLRGATVKKFFAGYELMAEAQRDLTPERAAARMRACSEVHYLETSD